MGKPVTMISYRFCLIYHNIAHFQRIIAVFRRSIIRIACRVKWCRFEPIYTNFRPGDNPVDKNDVEKIAQLARLEINENDIPEYATNLTNILALVEQMNSVDTDNVIPMAHPTDAVQRLRDDVVTATNQREHFQEIAPQVEDGLYLVPQVIE